MDKCRRELEIQMKREGEKAVMDLGIHSLHPDLVKLIGRLKYRTSYGQNVLSHSLEVAWLAGLMAGELGVNVQLARRAGLLHDIAKPLTMRSRAAMCKSVWIFARSTARTRRLFMQSKPTTAMWSPRRCLPSLLLAADAISASPPQVPAVKTWKAISSVWKRWKPVQRL